MDNALFNKKFNLFIATPYIFLKLRNKPLIAVLLSVSFALVIIYSAWYDGLLPGVDASNWPWSLSYIKQLLDIENNFVAVVVTFISRVIHYLVQEKNYTT